MEDMIDDGMCGKFVVGHMIKGGAVFMGLKRMVFVFWLYRISG